MIINNNLQDFIENINNGKIVCFKTDTIWGFSVDSNNEDAVKNLYKLKNRNLDKPFIFLVSKKQDLTKIVKTITPNAQKLINSFWPGPLTIIFEAKENLPLLKPYKNRATIALRNPNDNLCQELLYQLNKPLPSTSVNTESNAPLNNFEDICKSFINEDFCILSPLTKNKDITYIKNNKTYNKTNEFSQKNYNTNQNLPSTIISCINNNIQILREGAISKQDILNTINS